MKYTTIIVTYNRSRKLVKAVNSHLSQSIKPEKIIIVDNASNDDTHTLFEQGGIFHENSSIIYYPLEENVGGSGGFQFALEKALLIETDWILFGDDDAYFESNYVENLLDAYMAINDSSKIGVLSGTIIKKSSNTIETGSRSKIRNDELVLFTPLKEIEYKKNTYIDVFTFVGPMIKSRVIRDVGNIRSDYFIHYDDSEFSLRIKEKGYKAINISNAVVHHDSTGASGLPIRDWRLYYDIRNRSHMIINHGKSSYFFKIIAISWLSVKSFIGVLTRKMPSDYRYNVSAVVLGYKDAIIQKLGKNEKFLP